MPLQSFHFPSQSEEISHPPNRKRKLPPRRTSGKIPKVVIPRRPSERKLAPQRSKVSATTASIAVKFEGEKIRMKKVRQMEGNYIINIAPLTNVLRKVAVCKKCKEGGLEIFEDASGRFTFGSCLFIRCENCQNTQTL